MNLKDVYSIEFPYISLRSKSFIKVFSDFNDSDNSFKLN